MGVNGGTAQEAAKPVSSCDGGRAKCARGRARSAPSRPLNPSNSLSVYPGSAHYLGVNALMQTLPLTHPAADHVAMSSQVVPLELAKLWPDLAVTLVL